MLKRFLLTSILIALVQASSGAALDVSCPQPGAWTVETTEREVAANLVETTVRLSCPTASVRPELTVAAVRPQGDAQVFWHTDAWYGNLRPAWRDAHASDVRQGLPVYAVLTTSERNRLTLASDNCVRAMGFSCGTDERGNVRATWKIPASTVPTTNDVLRFRVDTRDAFWSDAVRDAAAWTHRFHPPAHVPAAAFAPVYSSWYAHHTEIDAATVLEEAKRARALGLEVFFLDAGWYMDKPGNFARPAGDWRPSATRFPDFAKTVAAVKALGLKVVLWYGLPLVGHETAAATRFKGCYMGENRGGAHYLDPRVASVREHLCATLEQAVREWNVDGFKIDYIYAWNAVRPARPGEGRDIAEIPEAVVALVSQLHARLRALKPDILLEFTHGHHNAAMRPYCTMYRVADCAGDVQENRSALVRLRLTNGDTACHSDMLTWGRSDTRENAARQILACLFGTVQYSIPLADADPGHLRLMEHWIGFMKAHADALQCGAFRPHHPEANYPWIEAENDRENVAVVYLDGFAMPVPADGRLRFVVNATGGDALVLDLARPVEARTFDTVGACTGTVRLDAGLRRVRVPAFGYVTFDCK